MSLLTVTRSSHMFSVTLSSKSSRDSFFPTSEEILFHIMEKNLIWNDRSDSGFFFGGENEFLISFTLFTATVDTAVMKGWQVQGTVSSGNLAFAKLYTFSHCNVFITYAFNPGLDRDRESKGGCGNLFKGDHKKNWEELFIPLLYR